MGPVTLLATQIVCGPAAAVAAANAARSDPAGGPGPSRLFVTTMSPALQLEAASIRPDGIKAATVATTSPAPNKTGRRLMHRSRFAPRSPPCVAGTLSARPVAGRGGR